MDLDLSTYIFHYDKEKNPSLNHDYFEVIAEESYRNPRKWNDAEGEGEEEDDEERKEQLDDGSEAKDEAVYRKRKEQSWHLETAPASAKIADQLISRRGIKGKKQF